MDGAHTHGHGSGPGPDLIPLIALIALVVLIGPTIVGIALELVHILVIALVSVIIVGGVGVVGLVWWKFHTHKIEPPWQRKPEVTQARVSPVKGVSNDELRQAMRLAIEDVLAEERRRRQ